MGYRVRFSLAACFLALCCFSSEANALPDKWRTSFVKVIHTRLRAHDAYVWGGKNPNVLTYDTKAKQWKKGLDCQGLIFFSARQAGIPGVCVVTSRDMARGLGGWMGIDLPGSNADERLRNATEADIIFWALSPDRPNGHVGALLLNPATGYPGVAHASSSRGVVIDEIKGWVTKQMTKIRRLTIGDKK